MDAKDNLKWWQKCAVYEAYPKSFLDTTGSGEGDLNGLTAKLDYLKALGVGAIWLTPIYPSPGVDNGYDIADFCAIDPRFGTMEDFERLVAEADKRGIRIVMDLVVNHTSDRHPWFQESKASRENPKADWYVWRDAKEDGSAPTNWRSFFSGGAWEWCEERGQYYLHTFATEQPDLNWENPAVRRALFDAANFWLEKGVGGFRIDAIVYIKKPAVFEDGVPDGKDGMVTIHNVLANRPGILDFLREFRREVFDGHDIMTVAEANGVAPEELKDWVGDEGVFSMLFEFSHVNLSLKKSELWCQEESWRLTELKAALRKSQEATRENGWYPIFFENHDRPRSLDFYFPEGRDRAAAARALGVLLMTMRGTPYIYEGEELGKEGVRWPRIDCYDDLYTYSQYEFARAEGLSEAEAMHCVHRWSRDSARTPMEWTRGHEAGFTAGKPWLPVAPDFADWCAEAQEADERSPLNFYRQLAALRFEGEWSDVLTAGDYAELLGASEEIFAFSRRLGSREARVLINFTLEPAPYDAALVEGNRALLSSCGETTPGTLAPMEAVIFVK